MSYWIRKLWMNPTRSAYWHGLASTVTWANRGPYPWEQPPCTALVKEGPKALLVIPEHVDWNGSSLWPAWQKWFRGEIE